MITFQPTATHPMGAGLGALSPQDRMGVSVFGSLLIHLLVILGVTFTLPVLRELRGLPTLEITLVQTQSDKAPENAEFLANANQDGGGQSEKPDIARNPLPVREISDTNRQFPRQQAAPQPRVESPREVTDLARARESDWQAKTRRPQPDKREQQSEPFNLAMLESADRAERARLNAEISRNWQEMQQRPRRKFLNARTREYKYATYMDAWRAKVERIGHLNYPEEAKRRRLTGSLLLDVVVRHDGSVKEITVLRSSGYKLLDDAAVRIVELSAPFAPFPSGIRTEWDELSITRTWKFNETVTAE